MKPGQESPFFGRADFYLLRYGPYLIGLNMSTDKSFPVTLPANGKPARELVSGRKIPPGLAVQVAPRSTAVFRFDP